MHKLAVKQSHESLLILLRYRTNGHNARIFYCMGETAITVVILLTPRKPEGCGGHTPNENEPYVKIATTTVIEKQKCILIQLLQSRDCNIKVCVYRLIRRTTSVRGCTRSNPSCCLFSFFNMYFFSSFYPHTKHAPLFFSDSPP